LRLLIRWPRLQEMSKSASALATLARPGTPARHSRRPGAASRGCPLETSRCAPTADRLADLRKQTVRPVLCSRLVLLEGATPEAREWGRPIEATIPCDALLVCGLTLCWRHPEGACHPSCESVRPTADHQAHAGPVLGPRRSELKRRCGEAGDTAWHS